MTDHPAAAILAQAEAAYNCVVADPTGSLSVARDVVRRARRSGDVEALIVALRARAWAERGRLSLRTAKRLLDEAAELADRHDVRFRHGEVLISRAAVNSELGAMEAAQEDLAAAARLVSAKQRPEVVVQRATLLGNMGRPLEAVRLFRSLLEAEGVPADIRVKAANNLAYQQALRGRLAEAARYAEQAEQEAATLGSAFVARVAQNRAWVTMLEGRLAESLEMFRRAAVLYELAGLPLGEHYLEYADALERLRLIPEALEAGSAAATQFTEHHVLLMAADAQLQVARLTLLAGDAEHAREKATRAAARFRRQGRTGRVARAAVVAHEAVAVQRPLTPAQLRSLQSSAATLERLGMVSDAVDAHLVAGRAAAARGLIHGASTSWRAASRLSRRSSFLVRLNGHVAAALDANLRADGSAVVRTARAGLADLDRHRAALPSMELRALASGHGAELGGLGLAALLPRRSGTRVFEWMERTRAAALVTVDVDTPADMENKLATLRALHGELVEHRRTAEREPTELLARITAAEEQIRRSTWSGASSSDPHSETVTASEIRAVLDGEMLVEYGIHDGRIIAAVVRPRRVDLCELGSVAEVSRDTDALLFALRRLTRPASATSAAAARSSASAALTRLHDQLVRPLGIPADIPLVVVPVGELQRIPWAPLHPAATTVAPSASLWARTRRARGTGSLAVALIAGPDLPGAIHEVDLLAKLHPHADVLVPPDSTAAATSVALRGAGLAHLACHGRIRADNPTFSSLLLSDGPLTVHELGMRGAPHRIVLAACDSGVQVTYPGDEALGFVSALFSRGTAGLIASTVLVPDIDALPLMRSLHEHVAGGASLAAALASARSTLDLDAPGQFVTWCAFNAYGAG